ncbi:MAG: hypothetical protein SVR08_15120 [Spirochaetota bacterium]|nr:hypothetical protein [Spirochaetota bacterium]
MRGKIEFIFIASLMFTSSCTGLSFKTHQRMEGFLNETIRVYIRIYLFDEEAGKLMNDIKDSQMLDFGRKRASRLLEAYIITEIDDDEKKMSLLKEISASLKGGGIMHKNCNDQYCEAFIDFNLRTLKEKIDIKLNF